MPRANQTADQSLLDQARTISAALGAQLGTEENVHIRNAVVHLERAVSELQEYENPEPVPPVVPEPVVVSDTPV